MIQDIAPHKFHNEFRSDAAPVNKSPVLCFNDRKMLARVSEGDIVFPTYEQLGKPEGLVYAFAIDETEYFLDISDRAWDLNEFEYIGMIELRRGSNNVSGMILFTGYHLSSWYKDNIYCGRCGGRTIHSDHERAMYCPHCNRNIYPRIMPAVIVGVTDGERLLVTQYRAGRGFFALIAGFVEIGETLEETVAREVMEETGLKVKNITYYKSQPWGTANDILTGYYCEVDGSHEVTLDENELRLAQWRLPEEIELQPDSFSLTNEMMLMFKEHGVFWK